MPATTTSAREKRRPRKRLSRHILFHVVLAISLPFLLLLGLLGWLAQPFVEQELAERHASLARAITGQAKSYAEISAGNVGLLAEMVLRHKDRNITELLDLASQESTLLSSLVLTTNDGVVLALGLRPERRNVRRNYVGMDLSRLEHVAETGRNRQPAWSNVYLSVIDGGLVVARVVPVGEDRLLIGEIPLRYISQNLQQLQSDNWVTVILDSKGHIIAHADWRMGLQQISLRNLPVIADALAGRDVVTDDFEMDGENYLGTAAQIPEVGWLTLVATPTEQVFGPVLIMGATILFGVLAAILAAILWLLRSSSRTASAVTKISDNVAVIAAGDYSLELPKTDVEELYQLGRHIRTMAGSIAAREQELRRSERQFRVFYEAGLVGLALMDLRGRWMRVNDSLCKILQCDRTTLSARSWMESTHPDDRAFEADRFAALVDGSSEGYAIEKRLQRSGGDICWVSVVLRSVRNDKGEPDYVALLAQDITERKDAEGRIERLAFYDSLTGLPNRRLFQDRLTHAMQVSAESHQYGSVVFLDLDNFKTLNDTAGHPVGDQLLIGVARRMTEALGEANTIARLGGDEFVVILEDLGEKESQAAARSEAVVEQLQAVFAESFALAGRDFYCNASLGICLFCGNQITPDEVLKRADSAMYQAKSAGRASARFYDPELQEALDVRTQLSNELHQAVPSNQLRIYLQPIVDRQGVRRGAEVLLRWAHPEKGVIPPVRFIPVAEETGVIEEIGEWVLRQAVALLQQWQRDPELAKLYLSVNLSPRQFRRAEFVPEVSAIVSEADLPRDRLKLELTETVLLDQLQSTGSRMSALQALGVGFALDDFGTGYSSLDYLKRLPFDQLKIDRSFVDDIGSDTTAEKIVKATLAMARSLEIATVAEGVASVRQFEFLHSHGCENFQGFYFGEPMPVEMFVKDFAIPAAAAAK